MTNAILDVDLCESTYKGKIIYTLHINDCILLDFYDMRTSDLQFRLKYLFDRFQNYNGVRLEEQIDDSGSFYFLTPSGAKIVVKLSNKLVECYRHVRNVGAKNESDRLR